MDSKTFTIGVLTTTAVVLLAALVIVYVLPDPVLASGMTTTGGPYVMTVGKDASGDQELVYVIDSVTNRLLVYRFDNAGRQIDLVQGLELSVLRGADQAPPAPSGRSQRPGRRRP